MGTKALEKICRSDLIYISWPLQHNFPVSRFLETTVYMAVPLYWINAPLMFEKCGCELLVAPDNPGSTSTSTQKPT